MWYTYILQCSDKSLYTGITTDIKRRLREHNGEIKSGAKYTLAKRPVRVVYLKATPTRSSALKLENAIKKLSHQEKVNLYEL